jgi:hypothetical protein
MSRILSRLALCAVTVGLGFSVFSAQAQKHQAVTVWSEGTRIAGDLWTPPVTEPDQHYPAILMSHGWGGTKDHLNQAYARDFARAGFIVLTIDYRGWGRSDGRLVHLDELPPRGGDGTVTVTAYEQREVVDPWQQTRDMMNAIEYMRGEPSIDADRIGIWGSSYSGGHVIYVAAQELGVAAVVSQVGYMGISASSGRSDKSHRRAIEKSRGEAPPQPPAGDKFPRLAGVPALGKLFNYHPINHADRITAPTLILDAEGEDYFDRKKNGLAVHEIITQNAPTKYVLYPGGHYDIYDKHLVAGRGEAIAWFKEHLMGE